MNWIKRNLPLVLGIVAAVVLLVLAGLYNVTRWRANAGVLEQLNGQYEELRRLHALNPHPGNEKQDNIRAAREQEAEVRRVLGRVGGQFQPLPAIPPGTNVTSEQFAAALRRTIDQLQRDATNASVQLPPQYGFSFEAQRRLVRFAPGTLERLTVQLGEVKHVCDLLFAAKINSLDGIRRERVGADDERGPATDYLERVTQTNELALLTPYEVTLRCFTPELAGLLAQFGNTPHGVLLKGLNVEPAAALSASPGMEGFPTAPVFVPVPGEPAPSPWPRPRTAGAEEAAFAERYGLRGGPRSPYGPGGPGAPTVAPTMVMPAPRPAAGMQTFLDEKQLKVTLLIHVVKLLPKNQ